MHTRSGALPSNNSFQPTSHSSLRSSCAAAELHRYASILGFMLLSLLVISQSARAEPSGYIVVQAIIAPASYKQPTYIAIFKNGRQYHLPNGKAVHEVATGTYTIGHIDIADNPNSGSGTISIPWDMRLEVSVRADRVTVVGIVEVDKAKKWKPVFAISRSASWITEICRKHKDLLDGSSILFRDNDLRYKERLLRCDA